MTIILKLLAGFLLFSAGVGIGIRTKEDEKDPEMSYWIVGLLAAGIIAIAFI